MPTTTRFIGNGYGWIGCLGNKKGRVATMACEELFEEEKMRYDEHQATLRAIRDIHRLFTPTAGKIFTVPSPEWSQLMELRLGEREQDAAYHATLDRLWEAMRQHHAEEGADQD